MITANELRIGNCIRDIWASDTACFRVEQLLANSCTYGLHLKAKYSNLIPIPLTEDILLNSGFELYMGDYVRDGIRIWTDDNIDYYLTATLVIGNPFQYVHQLQNLYYALTNTELIINL